MSTPEDLGLSDIDRRDLLKGIAIVLGAAISPGCQRAAQVPLAQRRAGAPRWNLEQRAIAHRCADLIMPATDTPSALAVGVGEFMDYVTNVWLQPSELKELLAGLDGLQKAARNQFNADFVDLAEVDQVALLTQMESADASANARTADLLDSKVFARLKELTVVGYYATEIGTKQEREYVPMPGRYDGYYKLRRVGKQWSS
ncbi:MAG: hypothetical protein CMQ44_03915 [Gammaproteobacteria bacterium]|nr:hypothetical protein [Gammaproteobacteria bacterium]|tara:strand:- start:2142 stop:2744 length:603 start_codon:yes stop_codon:yes gene_type:complete